MNARQKMINMMYLVLTALLALNVAKEVLNAFVVINLGLLQQKESLEGKNTAIIHGNLTVHGVTKPVSLDVVINKTGISPVSNKMTMGFSASTKLKRSDFGMTSFLLLNISAIRAGF